MPVRPVVRFLRFRRPGRVARRCPGPARGRGWLREGQNVYKASGTDEFQQKAEGLLTGTLPDLTAAGRRVAEERSLSVMGERLREVYRRMDILPAAQPAAKTNLPQAERPVQHSFTP